MGQYFKGFNFRPYMISKKPTFLKDHTNLLKVGTKVTSIGIKVKDTDKPNRIYEEFPNGITYSGVVLYKGVLWMCFKVATKDSPTRTNDAYMMFYFDEEDNVITQPNLDISSESSYRFYEPIFNN